MTRHDDEAQTRRRFAVALGSIQLDVRVVSVDVRVGDLEMTLVTRAGEGWKALHDHDPDDSSGHVSEGAGPTPEAALAACARAARVFDMESL